MVVDFDNVDVAAAVRDAAAKGREEGASLPEIIKAAVEAASAVEGVSPEDLKRAKKAAAALAMAADGDDSSSSSSSSETENEADIGKAEREKAKREGIAAIFYFNAQGGPPGEPVKAPAPGAAAAATGALVKAPAPPPPPQ